MAFRISMTLILASWCEGQGVTAAMLMPNASVETTSPTMRLNSPMDGWSRLLHIEWMPLAASTPKDFVAVFCRLDHLCSGMPGGFGEHLWLESGSSKVPAFCLLVVPSVQQTTPSKPCICRATPSCRPRLQGESSSVVCAWSAGGGAGKPKPN